MASEERFLKDFNIVLVDLNAAKGQFLVMKQSIDLYREQAAMERQEAQGLKN